MKGIWVSFSIVIQRGRIQQTLCQHRIFSFDTLPPIKKWSKSNWNFFTFSLINSLLLAVLFESFGNEAIEDKKKRSFKIQIKKSCLWWWIFLFILMDWCHHTGVKIYFSIIIKNPPLKTLRLLMYIEILEVILCYCIYWIYYYSLEGSTELFLATLNIPPWEYIYFTVPITQVVFKF